MKLIIDRPRHAVGLLLVRRLIAIITLLLICHVAATAQRFNLIPNGSFEEPRLTTCAGSPEMLDDWQTLAETPDVNWDGCETLPWLRPSGAGEQYMFLRSNGDFREGITVRLKEPLIVGQTYKLSFLAITRNTWLNGKGRLHIHLSENPMDVSNYEQGKMIWGELKDGKLRKKAKRWNRYEATFVADAAYEFIALRTEWGWFTEQNSVGIDDLSLSLDEHSCLGNLVPNPGFEIPTGGSGGGWPKFWDNIQGDYGAAYHIGSASDPNVMDAAHGGNVWFTLTSFQGANMANAAIGVELTKPLVPGRTYRLSFHAATKNNLVHHKGEIRVTADTEPITWGRLASGSTIMGDTRIDGDEEQWHLIEHVFVASDAFTHIAFQSRTGYHIDIDDICVTSDPFLPGIVQFTDPEYDVVESMGPGTVTLERIDGDAGTVTVDLQTIAAGGTATPGVDYTAVSTTVTFADGQRNATVQIPILDEFLVEGDETVALVLTNPTNGATLGLANARLNIIDDPITGKQATGGLSLEENILRRGKIVWASDKTSSGTAGTTDQLYYNEVRSTTPPKLIPGTSGGRDPVWSPDGRYIAYVVRETQSGGGMIGLTGDRLKIIDQQGNVHASWWAPTTFGEQFLGAPDWSDDGRRIAVPCYTFWPTTGLSTLDFTTAYDFSSAGVSVVIPESAGATALDPAFEPGSGGLYFHGHPSSGSYGASSFLFRQDLLLGGLPAVISGNGSVIDHAFSPSVDRSGAKLIFGSSAWESDPFDVFDEEDILTLDIAGGAMTRVTEESDNDLGTFARGSRARDQFVRQNNLDESRNQLALQRGPLVVPFSTDDDGNLFNDHAADWVIPKLDIWDLTATYAAGAPGTVITWRDVIVEPEDPQTPDVFTVERSTDGIHWAAIGQVTRGGTELVETSYSFFDVLVGCVETPVLFYRVGLADAAQADGYSWSLPVTVTIPPCEPEGGPDLE